MAIDSLRVLEKLDSLLKQNNYEKAKQLLIYWLKEAETEKDQRSVLLFSNELMGLCRKLSERDEAIKYAENALMQIKKMEISENVGAATTLLNAATVYKAFGNPDKAIDLFGKAKRIYEEKLPKNDDRLGGLYNNMGLALVDLKRFTEANECYKKALLVMEKAKNGEPEQAITYLNMATAAEMQYGLLEADQIIAEHIEKAMSLLDVGKERTDGNYAFVCEKCAPIFGYYGYIYYENQLIERYRRIYEGN